MKTKAKSGFKAVEFMREIRRELSDLYAKDKKQYFNEIRRAMEAFKKQRSQLAKSGS